MPSSLKIVHISVILLFCFGTSPLVRGQHSAGTTTADTTQLNHWVETASFDFIAQTAITSTGAIRQLPTGFDMKITRAAITSYLPYFGRLTGPSIERQQFSNRFTIPDYEYQVVPGKKGKYKITILPKNFNGIEKMIFTLSPDGYTILNITYNNIPPMSFNGYIKELNPSNL